MKEFPMRTMLIATATAALLAAALPAAAQETGQANARDAQTAQQQRARDASASERRVCVNERLSDSRMRRRICRTAREWADLQGGDDR
jgi:uncharacterized low-complexity protein